MPGRRAQQRGRVASPRRVRLVLAWALVVLGLVAVWFFAGPAGPRAAQAAPVSWPTSGGLLVLMVVMLGLAGLLVVRQPGNRIGLLFAAAVTLMAFALACEAYVTTSFGAGMAPYPGATQVAWVTSWAPPGLWLCMTLLLLWFPDGRLPSRRWRPVALFAFVLHGAAVVAGMVRPGPMVEIGPDNPYAWNAAGPVVEVVGAMFWPLSNLVAVVAAASLVVRFRSARGLQRQQMKWLALSGLLIVSGGFGLLVATVWPQGLEGPAAQVAGVVFGAGFVSVPVFAALAVLRYRLYDLDRIVSRTLSYAVLTGILAGVYAVGVFVISPAAASVGGSSQVAVAAATLGVAAAFQPVRRRVQAVVDRRFNRSRYDAERTIRAFAERLREPVDVDDVRSDLLTTATGVVDPSTAAVWVFGTAVGDA